MLDRDGYRPNVGIILANPRNEVFWAKRVNQHAWQFPQGGIQHGEMRGYMEVLDQEAYDKWYAQASKDAADSEPPEIWKFWPIEKGKEDTGDRDFEKVRKMYHAEKEKEKAEWLKEHAKEHGE